MCAVELGETMGVARKVRGGPIENDADAGLVAAIDEVHEVGGRAEAAGGREVAERLIAPRAIEGMLHDGQQFNVRIAEFLYVGNELIGEFAIREPAVGVFRYAPP